MNVKLYPWIPLLGLVLVACADKDTGLENPIIFVTSAIWQVATTMLLVLGVLL